MPLATLSVYLLCLPALLVILLTVIPRINALTREQWSPRWHVRRAGLVGAGVGAVMFLAAPFTIAVPWWRECATLALVWGIAGTWLTTPGMPPWWEVLTGRSWSALFAGFRKPQPSPSHSAQLWRDAQAAGFPTHFGALDGRERALWGPKPTDTERARFDLLLGEPGSDAPLHRIEE